MSDDQIHIIHVEVRLVMHDNGLVDLHFTGVRAEDLDDILKDLGTIQTRLELADMMDEAQRNFKEARDTGD